MQCMIGTAVMRTCGSLLGACAPGLMAHPRWDETPTPPRLAAGEPLNNYDAVMRAISIATHPMGLHFSKNKVTVSTVGLVPQLRRFCRSGIAAQLAVSLHAPNDALRSTIVPVNRTHSLALLTDCLRCDPGSFPRVGPLSGCPSLSSTFTQPHTYIHICMCTCTCTCSRAAGLVCVAHEGKRCTRCVPASVPCHTCLCSCRLWFG